MKFVAKTLKGMEGVLEQELLDLGVEGVKPGRRAVYFKGGLDTMYKTNLWLRSALRVLVTVHKFYARNEDELYKGVQEIDWEKYMKLGDTFAIDNVVHSTYFTHSKYVALKTKDAIVDQFKSKYGERPSVDTDEPTLRINIHVANDEVTLSLDSSGESLHKRGYRVAKHESPINEVLAAGMILLSGWKADKPFIDPFCGSGTLLIEAGLMAKNVPPGIKREFGFTRWENFDEGLWKEIQNDAKKQEKKVSVELLGSDKSNVSVLVAQENVKKAGLEGVVTLETKAFQRVRKMSDEEGFIVTNPPYGERLELQETEQLYERMGKVIRKSYPQFQFWIISSNEEAMGKIDLDLLESHDLFNGALECLFNGYKA